MAQAGLGELDDMEVVKSLGLDSKVAYTPEINKVALDAARKKVFKNLLDNGHSTKEAEAVADRAYKEALANIRGAEKKTGKSIL